MSMFSGNKETVDPDFNAIEMEQVDAEESMFESEDEIADMWGEEQNLNPAAAERKSKKANIFNQR